MIYIDKHERTTKAEFAEKDKIYEGTLNDLRKAAECHR